MTERPKFGLFDAVGRAATLGAFALIAAVIVAQIHLYFSR